MPAAPPSTSATRPSSTGPASPATCRTSRSAASAPTTPPTPASRSSPRYDLFALLGRPEPDNVDATLDLDYRGTHGPAVGAAVAYDTRDALGNARGYLLVDDSGTDEIGGRLDVEHSDDVRGFARAYHRADLPPKP